MLDRFSIGEHRDEFLHTGALLFDVWMETTSKPTRDFDFLGYWPAEPVRFAQVFQAPCAGH